MKTFHHHFFSPALGLFIIRLVAGSIFLFHGVDKLVNMDGTIQFFTSIGFSAVLAWFVALVEIIGGFSLIIGFWSRFFATLLAVIMLVAILKVKFMMGFKAIEEDILLLGSMIAILFSGCGRYSVCAWNHGKCDGCKDCSKGCSCEPHADEE